MSDRPAGEKFKPSEEEIETPHTPLQHSHIWARTHTRKQKFLAFSHETTVRTPPESRAGSELCSLSMQQPHLNTAIYIHSIKTSNGLYAKIKYNKLTLTLTAGSYFEYLSDFTEDIKSPKVLSGCVIFFFLRWVKWKRKEEAKSDSFFYFNGYQKIKKLRLTQRLKCLSSESHCVFHHINMYLIFCIEPPRFISWYIFSTHAK